jgi:hypothetical protein
MRTLITVAPLLAFAVASPQAQSLGEVARQEEARRLAITTPARLYTNDSLKAAPAPVSPPPTVPAGAAVAQALQDGQPAPPSAAWAQGQPLAEGLASAQSQPPTAPGASGSTVATDGAGGLGDEASWRARQAAARNDLARAQTLRDALESRVNALNTDFVNRDGPAQRRLVTADRQSALAALDGMKSEIQQHQKALRDIEEEARREDVPPGWLR